MRKQFFTKKKSLCAVMTAAFLCFGCAAAQNSNEENLVKANLIQLSAEQITVDGKAISQDSSAVIYADSKIETHEDVAAENQELANTIIHITKGGEYEVSGEAANTQIRITAPQEKVTLILNNAHISCATAPAIYVEDALDPQETGQAGVVLVLADGSNNTINGSHVAEYIDENGVEVDNDGAISSNISLAIDGTGVLKVLGDKEGIESKLHLTINNGNLEIVSKDDALNASEDGVSVITINGGIVNCSVQNGEEGDGIDSNGYIYINGGSVLAQAHSNSMDSGLDADLGIIINGGTVCATGNMYEEISDESAQAHVQFYFAERQAGNVPLVITDTDGNYILAYTPANDYSILELSMPALVDGSTYYLYSGGTVNGTLTNGIYTSVDSYEGGTQLAHRGIMTGGGRPDFQPGERPDFADMPEGMKRPDNEGKERPQNEGITKPDHEGMTPPPNMEPPTDGMMPNGFGGGANFDRNAAQSIEFTINSESRVYNGIAPVE